MGRTACTEPQCLYNGALYLYLYLYSPYGPYSLYRTSVPVQRCTLPLPIPLLPYRPYGLNRASVPVQRCTLALPTPILPLWTVRPVQSLSAVCKGALYLYLYLYSLYGPYSLYRDSVPVQRCTLPLPIPLLPLWTVRPVQSLSAVYKVVLYLYLYLYSPYVPYGLYRASVPVQRCTLTLPILLLPLWTVQPVQSLSACTKVHFTFTYTSTPPMDRTACTEPQCLYNGALDLYLYLYSPYGPYSLSRASVRVQRCTLTLPIPVLPLYAIRPVQSLSACTTVHFTFTYTSIFSGFSRLFFV